MARFPCSYKHGAPTRAEYIELCRQYQPEAELRRKADKARRRGFWTQESIDLACMCAREYLSGVFKEPTIAD